MVKTKQLRARVDDDLYERIQLKTDKMSDFLRDAVIEKLEKDEMGNQQTVAVEIRQLELLLETRQTIISQYEDLIDKETKECERIQAKITEKRKILERQEEREENINNNPATRGIFEDAVMFLLRKKYLGLEASVEKVLSSKSTEANYPNVQIFKEDLGKFIKQECKIGKTFNIEGTERTVIEEDLNYMLNRL